MSTVRLPLLPTTIPTTLPTPARPTTLSTTALSPVADTRPLPITAVAAGPDAGAAAGANVAAGRGTENDRSEAVAEARTEGGQTPRGELMQVGDLARESGKTVRAIHLYEELDLLIPVARSKGRYRLYDRDALMRIRWIGKLQDMGFSLTDIQTIVKDWQESGSAPRAMVKMREVYKNRLAQTLAHIQKLEGLRTELQSSLVYLDTCEVCDPERLLTACRACDRHANDNTTCDGHVPELVAGFRANNPKDVH